MIDLAKKLLIIRSASFQQLDKNLPEIIKQFPDYNISILTHEHGVEIAKKYSDIKNVYAYPYKESFRKKVKAFKNKSFDCILIPVTNISGVGFFNVYFFSLSIRARKRVVCNLVSEFHDITPLKIYTMGFTNGLFSVLSGILTGLFSVVTILLLPLRLRSLIKK